ncbi:MAG: B12-binding domain-containing radical SAM protein, partial [Clostridia bacterium]|nr:B12-binding domain-containing radical SAM protein [Clostridia bacterium]
RSFDGGRTGLKLYFMNGLPTETDDDIKGIAELAQRIVDLYYSKKRQGGGRGVNVTVSVSCFVPKPFTPFQWVKQDTVEELERKQQLLKECIRTGKISYKYHDARVSRVEAVFARGDRKLCKALALAHERGMMLDGWDEFFDYGEWMSVFAESGVDPAFYANREYGPDELLPWDFIDIGVTKKFMREEYSRAMNGETTPDCRTKCSACGAAKLGGEKCVCRERSGDNA